MGTTSKTSDGDHYGLWHRLRERGVLRVAASYAVIAWLTLKIADVTFEPLGLPAWAMPALIGGPFVFGAKRYGRKCR